METRRHYVRIDNDYRCEASLEFNDLDNNRAIETPVEGTLKITLAENIPHPVEVGIEDIDGKGDGPYVDFQNRVRTVENSNEYPIVFRFIANPSEEGGGKWYYYKTGDWEPNPSIDSYDDPEDVRHHIGIPSAQKIRLIHRILAGDTENVIQQLTELYGENRDSAAESFSDDMKKFVGFESRVRVQDFLVGATGFYRSHSATVNKVAKQITNERFQHRTNSLEDVQEMVATINEQEHFPRITIDEVFEEVIDRSSKTAPSH